jgi:hypothetical protein
MANPLSRFVHASCVTREAAKCNISISQFCHLQRCITDASSFVTEVATLIVTVVRQQYPRRRLGNNAPQQQLTLWLQLFLLQRREGLDLMA